MRPLRLLIFITLASVLTACSTIKVTGPRFQDSEKSPIRPDVALVYIYRVGQWTDIRFGSVQISIDEKFIFGVKDQGYTSFYIKPGKHRFKAEWTFMEKPLFEAGHFEPKTLSVDIEAGKAYYINYMIQEDGRPTTYMERTGLLGKSVSKSHVEFAGLVQQSESDGLKNLSFCKRQPNELE